ncbi:MAG: hypothetical protein M3525_13920, partial [Acidobacteriota bacterium]|nr:hypothetical protein [Acidobacteriota bacterium]
MSKKIASQKLPVQDFTISGVQKAAKAQTKIFCRFEKYKKRKSARRNLSFGSSLKQSVISRKHFKMKQFISSVLIAAIFLGLISP